MEVPDPSLVRTRFLCTLSRRHGLTWDLDYGNLIEILLRPEISVILTTYTPPLSSNLWFYVICFTRCSYYSSETYASVFFSPGGKAGNVIHVVQRVVLSVQTRLPPLCVGTPSCTRNNIDIWSEKAFATISVQQRNSVAYIYVILVVQLPQFCLQACPAHHYDFTILSFRLEIQVHQRLCLELYAVVRLCAWRRHYIPLYPHRSPHSLLLPPKHLLLSS